MQSLYSSNLHDDAKRSITPFHDVEEPTKLEGNEKILQGQEIHANWQLYSRQECFDLRNY